MSRKMLLLWICLVAGLFETSLSSRDECVIETDVNMGSGELLEPAAGCTEGAIIWHYPAGVLSVHFPRSLLGDAADDRRVAMRVCLSRDIGDGITSITEELTRRGGASRSRSFPHEVNALNPMDYKCSRRYNRRKEITLNLNAEGERFYMQRLNYKIETVERRRRKSRKNRQRGTRGRNTENPDTHV